MTYREHRLDDHTGFLRAYRELDAAGKKEYASKITYPGLKQSSEALKWLWDQQFAAVAADNPAFEVIRKCITICTPPSD